MGRVMVILIRWLFRRGRVLEMTHEVSKVDLRSSMWEHCSLRISRVELIELMLEVISLMSSLFWWLSEIKELSSWALVVAIWKNGKENGIRETKWAWRDGWDH